MGLAGFPSWLTLLYNHFAASTRLQVLINNKECRPQLNEHGFMPLCAEFIVGPIENMRIFGLQAAAAM